MPATADVKHILDSLMSTLVRAQAERSQRDDFVRLADGGSELGWVLYEREQMLTAVNTLRADSGKGSASIDAVQIAERRARGHVDYAWKFAIGCADLVIAD